MVMRGNYFNDVIKRRREFRERDCPDEDHTFKVENKQYETRNELRVGCCDRGARCKGPVIEILADTVEELCGEIDRLKAEIRSMKRKNENEESPVEGSRKRKKRKKSNQPIVGLLFTNNSIGIESNVLMKLLATCAKNDWSELDVLDEIEKAVRSSPPSKTSRKLLTIIESDVEKAINIIKRGAKSLICQYPWYLTKEENLLIIKYMAKWWN